MVAPGEVLSDSTVLIAGQPGTDTYPQFTSNPIDGTYRLTLAGAYWDYDEDRNRGVLLPEGLRVSNEFTLSVE